MKQRRSELFVLLFRTVCGASAAAEGNRKMSYRRVKTVVRQTVVAEWSLGAE